MMARDAPANPTRWGIVLLAYCAGVVGAFQIGKMPSALPEIRAELGLGLFAAGWVISAFNVVGVSVGVAIGAVADWLGHRRITTAALLVVAAASLGGAFAETGAEILASRFVEGIGAIVVFIAAPVIILRAVHPRDQRLALGAWGSYMPTGTALMVLMTPPLLDSVGWRGLWMVNAGILAAFALVLWRGTRHLPEAAPAPPPRGQGGRAAALWRDIRQTVSVPGPLLVAVCFATYTANYLAVLGFLPTFLIEERIAGATAAAVLTAIAIAANIPGNLLGAWLLHRGASRWLLIAIGSAIMGATSIGIYASGVPDDLRYLLAVAFSGFAGLVPSSIMSSAPVHAPSPAQLGTMNGLIVQGSNLGQVVGPPGLAALVAVAGGWQAAPWLVAVLSVIGVLLAIAIGRIERARGVSYTNGHKE
jgi:MFS family permease